MSYLTFRRMSARYYELHERRWQLSNFVGNELAIINEVGGYFLHQSGVFRWRSQSQSLKLRG